MKPHHDLWLSLDTVLPLLLILLAALLLVVVWWSLG
jgi:hypothetical protein